MPVRGRSVIISVFLAIFIVGALGFIVVRSVQSYRFAVAMYAVPPTPSRKLAADRPILVRIEKRSAGRAPAVAFLLGADGRLVHPMLPLSTRADSDGKPVQEVQFPPLGRVPAGGYVAAVVMRLPAFTPEAMDEIRAAIGQGGIMYRVYGRISAACARHGGHAEMVNAEVLPAAPLQAPKK